MAANFFDCLSLFFDTREASSLPGELEGFVVERLLIVATLPFFEASLGRRYGICNYFSCW